MFKEYYKDANDAIPANIDLKEKLLKLSDKKKTPSSFSFSWISRYVVPVTAVFIVLFSLPYIVSLLNNHNTKTSPKQTMVSKNKNDSETVSENDITPTIQENSVLYDSTDTDSNTNAKSAPNSRIVNTENDLFNTEEAFTKKGKTRPILDLSSLALPENMTLISNFEESTILYSENNILVYESDSKKLTLYISNTPTLFNDIPESVFTDNKSAIIKDGEKYIGYIQKENLYFKAECLNFTESEVTNLINSI